MNARMEAKRQLAQLERGAQEIIQREELLTKLERSVETGTPLRVKLGIDPTTKNVHLGHMVPYGKLRQFQDLGHRAVLIIGDYTASIGDPSGRNAERPPLGIEEVRANALTYADQIFRLVDRVSAELRWQSEWYGDMPLSRVLKLAGSFSLAQLLAHETFRLRYENGTRVGLHELLYPALQAQDSVMVGADVELGGTDQKFNILAGRELQRESGLEAQCALLVPLLPGLDGKKMSKSAGNDIPVACGPDEQFARIMALSDDCVGDYEEYLLLASEEEVAETRRRLEAGENPMALKLELAVRIVDRFNAAGSGEAARRGWERRFSRKEAPERMPEYRLAGPEDLCAVLKAAGLIPSLSEGRRLIASGAVYLDDEKAVDPFLQIDPAALAAGGIVARIGRRRYLRILAGAGIEGIGPA
jgi:tyrosyl-tRNA synthetase